MTRYSFHASHEQFAPAELLSLAVQAEAAGFDGVFCSDHLQPWAPSQGHSGFTWAWLGAALQATRQLSFATITVPGGWRYHPAVLAQAIGTLGQMYPGRLPWLAFGSGEAINEQVTGGPWPPKAERNARLQEGVGVIRALLAGERVSHEGRLTVQDARLWDRPAQPPLLFGAATSEATARWLGRWADGLLTLGRDLAQLRRLIAAFREGGGEGKPVHVKLDLSWAPEPAEALRLAHCHWRFNCLGGEACWDLRRPEDFEAAARFVRPEDLHPQVLIASEPARHIEHLQACQELGVSAIDLHQVSTLQREFIEFYGTAVLPALKR
ncbi:TIGR03885 family FMN-dependent LLM class oxidoreductase [Aquabacterium sp. A7-Y]|uniref:TIGR03885 family FMN-dependent LLM class oxidoreductase n=1 Tax=Aquabacterium sp. A7-Y TaxID=1349605 RepID=UPI00223CE5CB|nr:TIGR03885 family FMN-dependent LLM class oxidoreductase [Aquabacterium sp. A7-Y]MCW7537875.1 TIGR03885 family FMN-dependent LLM class oxidoreductase [Aquabacterium sp. A7-Y]